MNYFYSVLFFALTLSLNGKSQELRSNKVDGFTANFETKIVNSSLKSTFYQSITNEQNALSRPFGGEDKRQHEKGYIALGGLAHILNLSFHLLGAGINFDYFIYNSKMFDFGINIGARAGVVYDEDIQFSTNGGFIGLIGREKNYFEFTGGYNLLLTNNSSAEFYERIHLGLGYRHTEINGGTIRIGFASTAWLYGGVGYTFGRR